MKKFVLTFGIIILLALLVILVWYRYNIYYPIERTATSINFTIKPGENVEQISVQLITDKLIRSKLAFKIYLWQTGQQDKLQAGEYLLSHDSSLAKIVDQLTSGQVINQERVIKIIEGWNIEDINKYLETAGVTQGDTFKNAVGRINPWPFNITKPDFLSDAPANASLEGYLFPDTYRIYRKAQTPDIVEKLLSNFAEKLDSNLRAAIKQRGKTVFQVVTMASLIEKEVRTSADMKKVSGIFWQRLLIGQPLQSDATLSYILGKNKIRYSLEETEINSPYNTYRNQGLPPGPICNPGLNAILAAIYPEDTEYNYFLSRPDNGETVFSKTYEEHLANKAKYLY